MSRNNNGKNSSGRKRSSRELYKIRKYYAEKPEQEKASHEAAQSSGVNSLGQTAAPPVEQKFPDKFPFWARLKISKNRTTLVIDNDTVVDKKTKQTVDGFVHREATSEYHKGFEEIQPNPDIAKRPDPMYLKSPRKLPKYLFKPHNRQLDMPDHLRERYDKNNHKDDGDDGNN